MPKISGWGWGWDLVQVKSLQPSQEPWYQRFVNVCNEYIESPLNRPHTEPFCRGIISKLGRCSKTLTADNSPYQSGHFRVIVVESTGFTRFEKYEVDVNHFFKLLHNQLFCELLIVKSVVIPSIVERFFTKKLSLSIRSYKFKTTHIPLPNGW